MDLFNNGKVRVTDEEINIKGLLGTDKYQRKHISHFVYFTGFKKFIAIITNLVYIIGIPRAIKMMVGNVMVNMYTVNGKCRTFWLSADDYNQFKNVA